jgi:hypothetical protein
MALPSCIRTQPNPVFDASQNTSKVSQCSVALELEQWSIVSARCGKLSHTPMSTQICDLFIADLSLAW